MSWPADQVERWPLDRLIPYARNARTHSDAQVAQIAASIREFGWTVPVLADEAGTLIAGHGRVLAARQLGLREVPVMIARGWSAAQKRAYTLADNKLALNAGWDSDMLMMELGDIASDGFDLGIIGFHPDELAALLHEPTEGLTDPDDAPAAKDHAISELGDVWILGRHRLVCGDCTDAIIAAEMAGRCCHAIERSPQHVDVAVRRWQAFTGQSATLESDGETFASIEARRRAPAV